MADYLDVFLNDVVRSTICIEEHLSNLVYEIAGRTITLKSISSDL